MFHLVQAWNDKTLVKKKKSCCAQRLKRVNLPHWPLCGYTAGLIKEKCILGRVCLASGVKLTLATVSSLSWRSRLILRPWMFSSVSVFSAKLRSSFRVDTHTHTQVRQYTRVKILKKKKYYKKREGLGSVVGQSSSKTFTYKMKALVLFVCTVSLEHSVLLVLCFHLNLFK